MLNLEKIVQELDKNILHLSAQGFDTLMLSQAAAKIIEFHESHMAQFESTK